MSEEIGSPCRWAQAPEKLSQTDIDNALYWLFNEHKKGSDVNGDGGYERQHGKTLKQEFDVVEGCYTAMNSLKAIRLRKLNPELYDFLRGYCGGMETRDPDAFMGRMLDTASSRSPCP